MGEIQLNADVEIVKAALDVFHHQMGGSRLFKIRKETMPDNISTYFIRHALGGAEASILMRSDNGNRCRVTINPNDSELWGWQLGVPGRSELGVTTHLGEETSPHCEAFCDGFAQYLEESGYIVKSGEDASDNKSNGGRKRHPENDWASEQVHLKGCDKKEVFSEWERRRKEAGRPDLAEPWDSFKKAIKPKGNRSPHDQLNTNEN
jgi:hypothetical protein